MNVVVFIQLLWGIPPPISIDFEIKNKNEDD